MSELGVDVFSGREGDGYVDAARICAATGTIFEEFYRVACERDHRGQNLLNWPHVRYPTKQAD